LIADGPVQAKKLPVKLAEELTVTVAVAVLLPAALLAVSV
jgi:hypothetical protein